MKERISRKEFFRRAATGVAGLASMRLFGDVSHGQQQIESRIVFAEHADFTVGITPNTGLIKPYFRLLLKEFTGTTDVHEAWDKLIPGYRPDQVIGIKVNCINRSLSSHPQVVEAITESLIDAGVPANQIVIWERRGWELSAAGYVLNETNTGVRCFGTDAKNWGYDTQKPIKVGGQTRYLTKILTSHCDHLINVPVLKDHSMAGVTVSMKNHYGTVDNPGSLHGNNCDPYIAELNNADDIKNKTRLIVLDALLGIYSGGPGGSPQFKPNQIAVSTDPVAIDQYGLTLINEERARRGMSDVTARAKHIKTAADLGLGTNDMSRIELFQVEMPESVSPSGKRPTTLGEIKRG